MNAAPEKLTLGILAGLAAGAFWGFSFLVPQVLDTFSAIEVAFGRCFFFGLASFFSLRPALRVFARFLLREKILVFCLSAAGVWLYSIVMFWSVQHGGGVLTALVMGMIPVTIPLAAKKTRAMGKAAMTGLLLIFLGLVCLHAGEFSGMKGGGLAWLPALAALALWTWYGIKNSDFLKERPDLSKAGFTNVVGLCTFVAMCLVAAVAVDMPGLIRHEHFEAFVLWSALLGIGSSWVAYWLWNLCSAYCPPAVSGPLIVSETVFGLLFTFIHQHRLPTVFETAAILLSCAGVVLAIRAETAARG